MRRLIVLGNCVAQRLERLLGIILNHHNSSAPPARQWRIVPAPPVYNLASFSTTPQELADTASQCDVIFTQPLFNFGPLNTAILRNLSGTSLHTFSAPNFEAYFPDLLHPPPIDEALANPPPLEWHSRVFLECRAAGIPVEQVEKIYPMHPVFRAANMSRILEKAWHLYERREKGVEIGTLDICRTFYASEALFFTWKHPGDRIMGALLKGMLARLGFDSREIENGMGLINFQEKPNQPHVWSDWGFGFNAWPVINRHHSFFNFPGREFFRIAGREVDILTAAIAWYNYYDENPSVFSSLLKNLPS